MEEAILVLLREDPQKAQDMLYKQHKLSFIAFMKRSYHDDDEIDGIFTDAIFILTEKARQPGFVLPCPIDVYLKAICRNQIRVRKYKARRHGDNLGDNKEEFLDNFPDSFDEEREETNIQADLAEQVIKEMQTKSPKCYEILKRSVYEKQSMDKIARDMAYSNADSAKNQKGRCLKKFKVAFLKRLTSGQFKRK